MKRILVRYKVKHGNAADNEALVKAVFAELERSSPPDFRYATFRLDDGLTFVHLASIETTDGSNPLQDMQAFKAFLATIRDRCDEAPTASILSEIGSYRLF